MYKEYLQKLEKLKGKELKNTELKGSKRIELGLMQDVLSLHNKIEGFKDDMDGQLSKAKMSAVKVDTEIKNFNKLAGNLEEAAKDLGIPVGDMNLQKLYTNIKEWTKDATAVIKA